MNKKIFFLSLYRATTFLTEIFFRGGTQPNWKINEIPGGKGFDKHSRDLKQKRPPSSRYGYFLELHNFNLLLANSLLIFCRSRCSHRCRSVSFQLIVKHHTPNERVMFQNSRQKNYNQNNNNNKRMSRLQWLAGYLDIFSVQIKGWIPRDGHVVIIINTRSQITNFTKVLTYEHWDHGDLSRAKVCYCLNRKWISIAPPQVRDCTVRPRTSFLARALTVGAVCTVPVDHVMLRK